MSRSSKKHTKTSVKPLGKKSTKQTVELETYLEKTPNWSFLKIDRFHDKWCIGCCKDIYNVILDKLVSFEGQTWNEILHKSSNNHHLLPVDKLIPAAQKRLLELKLDYVESLLSLRLTGEIRLWGLLQPYEGGLCKLLWFDEKHEVCPANKKNT